MTKMLLLLILPLALFSQSFLISSLPIPKTYIQDLDPYECDETCLQEYIDKDMIFSFLSHANKKLANPEQDEVRVMNVSILNLGSNIISSKVKIALLLPYKKIGKYASSTTNAAFAYLITKSHSFELKSYKIENEDESSIHAALSQMQQDGFNYVIAPLTQIGATNIINLNPDMNIYLPTINKQDISSDNSNIIFGAIDYKKQCEMLMHEATSPLVIFSDESFTGRKLAAIEEQEFRYEDVNMTTLNENNEEVVMTQKVLNEEKKVIKFFISRRTTNLESHLKENEKIKKGTFIINTPIVKSGMIMSQLTLYDVNATNILSTQINYNPLLLSMTQYNDRKDMVVANSITQHNNVLTQTNSLLGNDIVYDWINYATTIGVDYFFNQLTNEDKEYNIPLVENQMQYDVELLKPSLSRFITYTHIDRTLVDKELKEISN